MTGWRWSHPKDSLLWQVAGTIGACGFVVALHLNNDGLWYQGDAPRHAANGLFWADFLSNLPTSPPDFAFSYYARYPVISPTAYPPVFYLLQAAAYRVFGVSGFVGKGLVLALVLLGALYVVAWSRRWISEDAGWAGGLFVIQPSMIVWGNAVMLNVPAMILGLAALYHWRRWLEDHGSRHLYAAGAFAMLTVLTYLPTAIVLLVMLAWGLWSGGLRMFAQPRLWIVASTAAIPIGAWVLMTTRWAPAHWDAAFLAGPSSLGNLAVWGYYVRQLPALVTVPVLVLAVGGVGVGLALRAWKTELTLLLLWIGLTCIWFSAISVKEDRYAILLVPPIVLLAGIALASGLRLVAGAREGPAARGGVLVWAAVLALHVGLAGAIAAPRVSGFGEIVRFVREVAPSERVFYDGFYNGVFSFYTRAADMEFRGSVVLGSKLLYATKIKPGFGLIEIASSPADVREAFRVRCGCRILVVERQIAPALAGIAATVSLREVVAHEPARLLRSFRVEAGSVTDVDVYEFSGVESVPSTIDLHFPALGHGTRRQVKPIER